MDRDALVSRYRRYREIVGEHKSAVVDHLPGQALLDQARFLRIASGRTILTATPEEHTLVLDLAIHAPRHARSRAYERYRRVARLTEGSDEARVLDALCAAQFVIGAIERRHDVAGVVGTDLLRQTGLWLMDINLESTGPEGFAFAGHLITLDGFSMTIGAVAPVDRSDLEDALAQMPATRAGTPAALADDPLFANLICRAALARGAMDQIRLVKAGAAFPGPDRQAPQAAAG